MTEQPTRIGGRYELGELLGRGGMAEVRKGTDVRLGRVVAIKRLRTDLVDDPMFQARFRREAQSAASLNHPAIAAVYDTGEEQAPGDSHPHPYIVMEYVAGRTLREILREGRKILPERALEIVSGVLSALDYSHRAGIIHRDIKPANVMLTPGGDVKVMDFGIARALADATSNVTQTAAVIGTAQYLSPEQARGEQVDSRSDVYSAGCLLYELLTGRPPFVGESPVSVAYQHVREQARPPSAVDPSLPPAVDAIVMKALAKRIEDRYQSAAAMRQDIERYLAGKPVTAPPPVVLPPPAPEAAEPTGSHTSIFDVVDEDDEPPRKRWPLILMSALILALLAAAVVFGAQMFNSGPEREVVPRVIGLTVPEAEADLQAAGLALGDVQQEASSEVEAGRIISQSREPREEVPEGTEIDVVVSVGPRQETLPFVIGEDKEVARAQLEELGFRVRLVERESPEPRDTVIATDPQAGATLDVGTRVRVFWSSGPVEVPDVVGRTEEEARRILSDAGFEVQVVRDDAPDTEFGTVLSQTPEAESEVERGSTVIITVSSFEPEPEPTPTPTPTPTPSPTETPTETPSETPTP